MNIFQNQSIWLVAQYIEDQGWEGGRVLEGEGETETCVAFLDTLAHRRDTDPDC